MSDLHRFQDKVATVAFGMSVPEAIKNKVCIKCKNKVTGFNDALSSKEYRISALCQSCQDDFFTSFDDY